MAAESSNFEIAAWSRQHPLAWVLESRGAAPDIELTPEDAALVDPVSVQRQLYVSSDTPIWEVPSAYGGVVFPATEFPLIARSPRDMARHMDVHVRKARIADPDKAEVVAAGRRSGEHILTDKMKALEGLDTTLSAQHVALRALRTEVSLELRYPNLRCYPANRLGVFVDRAETAIMTAVEVAAERRSWSDEQYGTALMVLQDRLYGGSNFRQLRSWYEYILVAGPYVKARRSAIVESRKKIDQAIKPYQTHERSSRAA